MAEILAVLIILIVRLGIPIAVMTLIAILYSRYEHRHVH